jgi:hypothetical protein
MRDFSLIINSDDTDSIVGGAAYVYVRFRGVYIRSF